MSIRNDCPYAKAVIDASCAMRRAEALRYQHRGHLSNDVDHYPDELVDNTKRFAKEHGSRPSPISTTRASRWARAYDAVRTPDLGLNDKLELQYRGRLDASRKEAAPPDARRELFEAMREVAETGRGPREQTASMGCSIKWKAA